MQVTHNSKVPGFNPCTLNGIYWFPEFDFTFNLYRYGEAENLATRLDEAEVALAAAEGNAAAAAEEAAALTAAAASAADAAADAASAAARAQELEAKLATAASEADARVAAAQRRASDAEAGLYLASFSHLILVSHIKPSIVGFCF
jgi:hypothetical protein